MTKAATPLTVEEMVSAFDLRDVRYYQLKASLNEVDPPEEQGTEVSVDLEWGLLVRHEGTEFGIRISVDVTAPFGDLVVDVAAEYESSKPETLSRTAVEEYVNNVSFMQLFPYIREAVADLARKVSGQPILLPVFERGSIVLEVGPGPDISPPH